MNDKNKVTKPNQVLFEIEKQLREFKETGPARMKLFKALAEERKQQYDIYIKSGFTPEQALALIKIIKT